MLLRNVWPLSPRGLPILSMDPSEILFLMITGMSASILLCFRLSTIVQLLFRCSASSSSLIASSHITSLALDIARLTASGSGWPPLDGQNFFGLSRFPDNRSARSPFPFSTVSPISGSVSPSASSDRGWGWERIAGRSCVKLFGSFPFAFLYFLSFRDWKNKF